MLYTAIEHMDACNTILHCLDTVRKLRKHTATDYTAVDKLLCLVDIHLGDQG